MSESGSEHPIKPYKIRIEPRGNPDDPVWQAFEKIEAARKRAMRHALDTGEPFVDPHPLRPRWQEAD